MKIQIGRQTEEKNCKSKDGQTDRNERRLSFSELSRAIDDPKKNMMFFTSPLRAPVRNFKCSSWLLRFNNDKINDVEADVPPSVVVLVDLERTFRSSWVIKKRVGNCQRKKLPEHKNDRKETLEGGKSAMEFLGE